ncbi:MAG: dTDP-glucose 4,6-dehydratase [Firmicutes bacterium]|nr:dTDP-glucose 4,6-dehydratase [Bacillota bacterium]
MKNILVTGGAGFIGANFVHFMLQKKHRIINLDVLTYAGNLDNLSEISNPLYTFIKGDICDKNLLSKIFAEHEIDTVVHFAAESHVDRSITGPEIFIQTNVNGTFNLLEVAKQNWKLFPADNSNREFKPNVRFLQVSTDEVYGALGKTGLFTEETPLAPNSPYSASKASADMFVRAYGETFGLPVNITRCSNNYGAYQFPEKLIPLMVTNALRDIPLPVYGKGDQVRDWLHVSDHCSAIYAVLTKGKVGEVYNIGGNNEKQNIEVVKNILQILGKPETLIKYVQDRPGHDKRYAIDNSKITAQLGWQPQLTFEEGIAKTLKWYVDNQTWTNRIISGEYKN